MMAITKEEMPEGLASHGQPRPRPDVRQLPVPPAALEILQVSNPETVIGCYGEDL